MTTATIIHHSPAELSEGIATDVPCGQHWGSSVGEVYDPLAHELASDPAPSAPPQPVDPKHIIMEPKHGGRSKFQRSPVAALYA